MTDDAESYVVLLDEEVIGTLAIEDDAPTFRFDPAYGARADRPILSLSFEDEPSTDAVAVRETDGRLPRFFRNLLPEGHLLSIYQRQIESARHRELDLLALIGEDLPGAVRVLRDPLAVSEPKRVTSAPHRFAFGLAGVQFKLQASRGDARLTIPARGESGQYIAKFGSPTYPELVQNEWAMLEWGRMCGLNVPEFQLVDSRDFEDPSGIITAPFEGPVLLIRRFDRDGAERLHQEDFAQVLSLHPEQKYDPDVDETVHYTTIGNIVEVFCGREGFIEYLRRLLFMLLSGNCDAHTKNWALTHESIHGSGPSDRGRRCSLARLSPVYDVVSTIAYPAAMHRQLALSLSGELRLDAVTREHLLALCSQVGVERAEASAIVTEFCGRARDEWALVRARAEVPARVRKAIDQNLALCASATRGL